MKRAFSLLAIALLAVESGRGVVSVPRSWSGSLAQDGSAVQESHFIAHYNKNDVSVFLNDPSNYKENIANQIVSQTIAQKLLLAAGDPPTPKGLAEAVKAEVAADPNKLVEIVVAGFSIEERYFPAENGDMAIAIVVTALQSLPTSFQNQYGVRAIIIGFALQKADSRYRPQIAQQLRRLILFQRAYGEIIPSAEALDQALQEYGIFSAIQTSSDFATNALPQMHGDNEADIFAAEQLAFSYGFIGPNFDNELTFSENGVVLPSGFAGGGSPDVQIFQPNPNPNVNPPSLPPLPPPPVPPPAPSS